MSDDPGAHRLMRIIKVLIVFGLMSVAFIFGQGSASNDNEASVQALQQTVKALEFQVKDQTKRLRRANISRANDSLTIKKLGEAVGELSQQKFAKCRAERNKFEKALDANAGTKYAVAVLLAVGNKRARLDANPQAREAVAAWLMAVSLYQQAVTAPDNCSAL